MWNTEPFFDYLEYEKAYSEDTLTAYRNDIRQFEEFCEGEAGEILPSEVTAELIREWMVVLMERGYTSTSVNRKLSSLRTFYKHLLRSGEIKADPLRKIRGPKNKKPLPVFLKESDMNRLLDEVKYDEGFKGCRDRMMIEMFYLTGMRLSELVGLDVGDVDFSASVIKVTGKRNKQRVIPFTDELNRSMRFYLQMKQESTPNVDDAFFVRENGRRVSVSIVGSVVKRYLSKVVTVRKRSPHVLRHTFATTMLNNDAELGVIGKLLGHESLSTTEIYTHTTFEELKKTYKQAHPRA